MMTKTKHSLHFSCTKYALSLVFSLFIICTGFSQTTKNSTEKAFTEVDQMPQFPGCNEAEAEAQEQCSQKKFLAFVYKNLKYPKEAAKEEVEGMVLLSFVVTTKGTIKDISIKRSLNKACDAEAIRVVELMNEKGIRWTAGQKDGKAVDASFILPLKFKLK